MGSDIDTHLVLSILFFYFALTTRFDELTFFALLTDSDHSGVLLIIVGYSPRQVSLAASLGQSR